MAGSQQADMQYNLRGLNMVTPDQSIDDSDRTKGQSPYTINSRMFFPKDTDDPRSASQNRLGAGFYTVPVGEALDTQNTTTTSQSDLQVSNLARIAQRFTPTQNKALTAIDLNIKSNDSIDTVQIDIYEDVSGNFGNRIARTSLRRNDFTSSYGYVKARFSQAPTLSTAKNYWIVVYGSEPAILTSSHVSRTTAGSNMMISNDAGTTWAPASGSFNFKTYLSTPGTVKGLHRFVTKTGVKQTLFAHGDSIYRVTNESTGAITAIKTGLNASASRVRFVTVLDKVYIVNGYDSMMIWDGTTMTTATHNADFKVPENIILHKNRAFYYSRDDPTRLYFSELYPDLQNVSSVNFIYIPDPASPDPITGFTVFQDQLVIFKKESKWLLVGDDLATFSLNQSPGGTKGAVSQEAIANGETRLYFWSIDGGPYYYDGVRDVAIGDNIQPIIHNVTNIAETDAIVTDREVRFYFKYKGAAAHQHMLLMDLRYKEWFFDTETYTRLPISWTLEDNQLVEASSVVGAVYFGEVGNNHLGAPILYKYWTNYKKYTSGIAKDRVRKFRAVFASPDRTMTVQIGKDADFDNDARIKNIILTSSGIVYDGGETYGSPTALYGKGSRISQPKVSLSGRANNTQYRFEKDVLNTPVSLYGYEGTIKSGRMR